MDVAVCDVEQGNDTPGLRYIITPVHTCVCGRIRCLFPAERSDLQVGVKGEMGAWLVNP